jgi:hypothetical protein
MIYHGKETPSSAEKCPERFGWKFIKFLQWTWNFKKRYQPHIIELLHSQKHAKIYILRSRQEIRNFSKNYKLSKIRL